MENIKTQAQTAPKNDSLTFLDNIEPFHSAEEYTGSIITLFQALEKPANLHQAKNCLDYLESRLRCTTLPIPFEREIKKYHFNPVEKFFLLKIIYSDLFGGRFSRPNLKDLFQFLSNSKLCSVEQAVQLVFQPEGKLYRSGVLTNKKGELNLKDGLLDCFLGRKKDSKKKTSSIRLPSIADVYKKLNQYIIGQENAKQSLAAAIYEHFLRCQIAERDGKPLEKNNVLLIGPTGTGKTYLCRTLAELLKVPFYIADASQMTDTGYVGLSADSVLTHLQKKIPAMNRKFPPAIVYLDEIDKTCQQETERNVNHRGVQEEFLKLLESNEYTTGGDRFGAPQRFDISNIMFIAGGAFAGLEDIVAKRCNQHQIGFNAAEKAAPGHAPVLPQDLEEYGFMPEFIGRFTTISQLDPLTEQDLTHILSKAKNNPLTQYKKIFKEAGVRLEIPAETLNQIAAQALKNGTGARGLKTILSRNLNQALFWCKTQNKKKYTLTPSLASV